MNLLNVNTQSIKIASVVQYGLISCKIYLTATGPTYISQNVRSFLVCNECH